MIKWEELLVIREEANFDRACDTAKIRASGIVRRINNSEEDVKIEIIFAGYQMFGSMIGWEHHYTFNLKMVLDSEDVEIGNKELG